MSFEDGSSAIQVSDSGETTEGTPKEIAESAKQLGSIMVESFAVNHITRPDLIFRGNTLHAPGEQRTIPTTVQS